MIALKNAQVWIRLNSKSQFVNKLGIFVELQIMKKPISSLIKRIRLFQFLNASMTRKKVCILLVRWPEDLATRQCKGSAKR